MLQEKENFRFKLDRFLIGCDAIEEKGLWDTEENGYMSGFYQNDLLCFILRITAADSFISDDEVELVNELFGFEYDKAELDIVYESCEDIIRSRDFEDRFTDGFGMLEDIDPDLAKAYKELLLSACELAMKSDHFSTAEEQEELERVADLLR